MITMNTIKEKDFRNIYCFVSEFNKKAEQNGWVNLTPSEADSEHMEINGEINLYSQHLGALFFSIESIQVQNMLTFEIFEISTKDLLAIYTEGYKEGVKQFRDEYKLTMKDLTTIDTENHIEALKASYFHNGGWMGLNGWIFAKNTVFSSFTLERLKEYGKESGLLSEADKYIKQNPTIFKDFHTSTVKHSEQPDKQESKYSNLTVLQWGAIFYYADTTNLLPKSKTKIAKLTDFIEKHKIETTVKHLRTQYYKANNQINKYNDYPIEKLEEIIPFLSQYYKQTVAKVQNDIELLQEYKDEYE